MKRVSLIPIIFVFAFILISESYAKTKIIAKSTPILQTSISAELESILSQSSPTQKSLVEISIREDDIPFGTEDYSNSVELINGTPIRFELNGEKVDRKAFLLQQRKFKNAVFERIQVKKEIKNNQIIKLTRLMKKHKIEFKPIDRLQWEMKHSDILRLKTLFPEFISAISVLPQPAVVTSVNDFGLDPDVKDLLGISKGYDYSEEGNGAHILHIEYHNPDFSMLPSWMVNRVEIMREKDTNDSCMSNDSPCWRKHATMTLGVALGVAPLSTIHSFAADYALSNGFQVCSLSDLDSLKDQIANYAYPIHVITNSWVSGSHTNDIYNDCAKYWDDFVYDTRINVSSGAGNTGEYVQSPAEGANVIGVGAYNHHDNTMWDNSAFKDNETKIKKPDIVAPGVNVPTATNNRSIGTSVSAPIAAGMIANFIGASGISDPSVIKAYMMATATNNIHRSSTRGKDGTGGVHYYPKGEGRVTVGSVLQNTVPDGNYAVFRIFVNQTPGQRYRIAVAWLTPGSYLSENLHPHVNYNLKVMKLAPNELVATSNSSTNNFEIVDFTASETGFYYFTVEKTFHDQSSSAKLALGWTLIEVTD